MKLRHWSYKTIDRVTGKHQNKHRAGLGKPTGLWLSDESRGAYGWRAWCRDNSFRSYSFRYEYEIKLVENPNILLLSTAREIDIFADMYKAKSELNDAMASITGLSEPNRLEPSIYEIDWKRVAKKYHGILITPYIWEQRLGRHMWYYGWDCASGCIWNPRSIESINLIKERKVPKRPTRAQERRKHKRMIQQMQKFTENISKELAKEMS